MQDYLKYNISRVYWDMKLNFTMWSEQLFWKPSLNIYPYKLKMYLVISIDYSQANPWMLKVIQKYETATFVRVFR